MCGFDQIGTNNLSSYLDTGKEGKRELGLQGKSELWSARGKPGGLGLAPRMVSVKCIEHILAVYTSLCAKHVTCIMSLTLHTIWNRGCPPLQTRGLRLREV